MDVWLTAPFNRGFKRRGLYPQQELTTLGFRGRRSAFLVAAPRPVDVKTPRVTIRLAAVPQLLTNWLSGVHGVIRGSRVIILMAVRRVIRRRLKLLLLIGCQEGEDLRMIRLV